MANRFSDRASERLFNGQPVRSLPVDIQRRARMRLQREVAATALGDLRVRAFPIGSSPFAVTGGASTASVSTIGGACVLSGRTEARWRSKFADYH